MLCKCHWIVLYTVHFTAFCLEGPFFPGHGVDRVFQDRVCVDRVYLHPKLRLKLQRSWVPRELGLGQC